MSWWPFRRRGHEPGTTSADASTEGSAAGTESAPDAVSADGAGEVARAPRTDWQRLAPPITAVGRGMGTVQRQPDVWLASYRNPTSLRPLVHGVDAAAPSGIVQAPAIQREALDTADTTGASWAPQRRVELGPGVIGDLPVARAVPATPSPAPEPPRPVANAAPVPTVPRSVPAVQREAFVPSSPTPALPEDGPGSSESPGVSESFDPSAATETAPTIGGDPNRGGEVAEGSPSPTPPAPPLPPAAPMPSPLPSAAPMPPVQREALTPTADRPVAPTPPPTSEAPDVELAEPTDHADTSPSAAVPPASSTTEAPLTSDRNDIVVTSDFDVDALLNPPVTEAADSPPLGLGAPMTPRSMSAADRPVQRQNEGETKPLTSTAGPESSARSAGIGPAVSATPSPGAPATPSPSPGMSGRPSVQRRTMAPESARTSGENTNITAPPVQRSAEAPANPEPPSPAPALTRDLVGGTGPTPSVDVTPSGPGPGPVAPFSSHVDSGVSAPTLGVQRETADRPTASAPIVAPDRSQARPASVVRSLPSSAPSVQRLPATSIPQPAGRPPSPAPLTETAPPTPTISAPAPIWSPTVGPQHTTDALTHVPIQRSISPPPGPASGSAVGVRPGPNGVVAPSFGSTPPHPLPGPSLQRAVGDQQAAAAPPLRLVDFPSAAPETSVPMRSADGTSVQRDVDVATATASVPQAQPAAGPVNTTVVVQRADEAPAGAASPAETTVHAATGATGASPEEDEALVERIYERLRWRLRGDLLVERERHGQLTHMDW